MTLVLGKLVKTIRNQDQTTTRVYETGGQYCARTTTRFRWIDEQNFEWEVIHSDMTQAAKTSAEKCASTMRFRAAF